MAKKCIYCGMTLEDNPEVCPICGTPVNAKIGDLPVSFLALGAQARRKRWRRVLLIAVIAALICLPFGWSRFAGEEAASVPAEQWDDHLFLDGRNAGVCKQLLGKVELFFVFVEDVKSDWTPEEKAAVTEQLQDEISALKAEALNFGVTLEINPYYTNLQLLGAAEHTDYPTWPEQYAKEQGHDSLAAMQRNRGSLSTEFSAPVVFLFDCSGRSYAYSGTTVEDAEYAVLFEIEAFRHELFHLYGAEDYYYHQLTKSSAKKYLPGSIMNDGEKTDDLTAYTIGWKDFITENATSFLEATAKLTYAELIAAQTEDMITGIGTVEYDTGEVYNGDLVDGIPQGQGTLTYPDGSIYQGAFESGYFHGKGTYTDATYGYSYTGDFRYNLFHGQGELTYENGDVYVGEFRDDWCHGQGVYTFSDGSTYKGSFEEDKFHGYGVFVDVTYGYRYEGEFVNDLFEGKGTLTFDDGDVYVGEFKNDLFNGQGTYTFADGRVYEGRFKDDKFHGQGTMTYPDGTVESGRWFDGKFAE